jgi:outer membrane receptor protein involved in Fe transport
VSGDLGWIADLAGNWQLLTNIGYGFRAPNIFDLGTLGSRPGNRFNVPNANLDSERVTHGDLGVRYRSGRAELTLTAFAMHYRDRITSVLTGDLTPEGREVTQSVNAATSDVHGLEGSTHVPLAEYWTLEANITYTWGEQVFTGAAPEPADRIPPLNGTLRIVYDPESHFRLEAWADFAGKQTRLSNRDISDVRMDPNGTPAWASVGARVMLQQPAAWTWTATISNVSDVRYRVHGSGIDAVGRNLALAVRYQW